MKIAALAGVVAVLVFSGAGAPSHATAAGPIACEQLARVSLTNAAVISAESVPAGGFSLPASRGSHTSSAIPARAARRRSVRRRSRGNAPRLR